MSNLKIGITGDSGFIGTQLKKLLGANSSIELIPFVGDLLDPEAVSGFFENHPDLDQVIHLAGT
ncbi:MAG: NAD-dependent dehydratase, partial [Candidatus Peregrinibacteria bacterium]|nr:NAD-dependent dehydratase [Candidatus Peregrinibacteria bacterium]